ncbi:ABC transporter ATP-binding protein [Halomicrobium salinisoli]|uniref:ABC transporter ATP-binding protein n=1 Tax=Halomicrobium salinisoli TaxID=2878391 RepID=UPI001CEFB61B|nr:ABC transporter ATP-binding protein [Halomicrobium salinisoli]
MAALELRSLHKRFGDVVALRGVDLTVEEGEVFGFLGPNGAGKSTTIDIVLDYLRPTGGEARVFGLDAQTDTKAIRRRTGVLPDAYHLDGHLTARQHLDYAVDSKGADDDPAALLDRVDLADAIDRRVGGFSKGMTQRLLLAMALVGDPDLIVLDEPSTGLDPNGARMMRDIVREERERGATVFFSSHILGQVEAVCDRVGILQDGELIAQDTIEGLQAAAGSGGTITVTLDARPDGTLDKVRGVAGVSNVAVDGRSVTVACPDDKKAAVVDVLRADGADVLDIETSDADLEDLFAAYTGGER